MSTSTTHPPAPTGTVSPDVPRALFLRRHGRTIAETATYLVAALATTVGVWWALGLSTATLSVPFAYWGDAVATSAHVKTTLEMGWYESQPLLGVPAGQHYHDFPTADNLHLIAVRVLGLFTSDWATVLNLYFLLGFPLAALTAVYFLRRIGAGRAMAAVGATLFALAPYHFVRGESHLWLASYYVVPLALLVVVRAFQGENLWRAAPTDAPRRPWTRAAVTAVGLVTVATASTYYAVFTVTLLAVAGVAAFAQHRQWRRFLGAVSAGVVVVATALLNMLPDLLYSAQNGPNGGGLVRSGAETEIYALKITALLLPVPNHVVDRLADLRASYNSTYPLVSELPVLGGVAAVGLVLLLVVVVLRLAQLGATAPRGRWAVAVALGSVTLVALLFSTVGGVSSLLSFLTPDLRGWNRMSIFVALLALGGVALAVDQVGGWLRARTSRAVAMPAVAVVAVVLLVGGTVDQVGRGSQIDHAAVRVSFDADARWVGEIEDTFGADATVFQLPYLPFPESGITNGVIETDQLKPYLHSATLGWSAGGIKGRARTDWPAAVSAAQAAEAGPQVAAAGFSALVVDRQYYGAEADTVTDQWTALVGPPVVTSPDGRHEVFDLRPLRTELLDRFTEESVDAAGHAVTHPTLAYPGEAVTAAGPAGEVTWTAAPDEPLALRLDNADDEAHRVTVTFTLSAAGPVVAEVPWGDDETLEPGQTVRWVVDAAPGHTEVSLRRTVEGPVQISAPAVAARLAPLELLVER